MTNEDRYVDQRRYGELRAIDEARVARDIQVAEILGALKSALESVKTAVEETKVLLNRHVETQTAEDRLRGDHIERELKEMKGRISALENIHKREDAQKEQISKWARVLHMVLGGVITTGLLWAAEWVRSSIAAANHVRPAYMAFFVAVTMWAMMLAANAATYYVAPTGDNAASGTISAPWKTIGYAATRVSAGDIVIVRTGSYPENVRTTISGQAQSPITYRAETPGGSKIVPPASSASDTAWDQSGAYVTIQGFEIDGSAPQSGTKWRRGIRLSGAGNTVNNVTVHDIGRTAACSESGYGIGSDGPAGAEFAEINGNTVYNIGPSGGC